MDWIPGRKTARKDGSAAYEATVEIRDKARMKVFNELALDASDEWFAAHPG
jgi:hypothetical protein